MWLGQKGGEQTVVVGFGRRTFTALLGAEGESEQSKLYTVDFP